MLPLSRNLTRSPYTLAILMTGVVSSWIVICCGALEDPAIVLLSSLLSDFAPLVDFCVSLIVISIPFSYLIYLVKQTLANDDGGIITRLHPKCNLNCIAPRLPDLLALSLALKEHSPPVPLFS